MIYIGICDDVDVERKQILNLCEKIFRGNTTEHEYIQFSSGEEVLDYCDIPENNRIDLLFLDVEMQGISGLELKQAVLRKERIWRIAFVTSHEESVYAMFSQKTIGFIKKPASFSNVAKMVRIVLDEMQQDIYYYAKGVGDEKINIKIENIAFFKACGSYTAMYTYSLEEDKYILISKKIGEIEKQLQQHSFVRVHRSYLVNLANVIGMDNNVTLRDMRVQIPMGRLNKENIRKQYLMYGENMVIRRL